DFTFMTFGSYTGLGNGLSISDLFTFDLTNLSVNGLPAGLGANLQNWGADAFMKYNSGTLTMSIPEPSTYGIGLGALALAFAAIRRRQIKAKKEIA
ncbi:MAG: PEP-CTERM sorting domain-containing protein, partial [bacterium]